MLRNIPQIKLRMINILLHAFEKNVRPTLVSRSPPNCMRTVWYCLAWLAPHVVGFVIFDYSDIYSVLNLKMHCITIHVTCDVFGFDWANNLCRIILIEILENFESLASLILSSKTCVELILWIRTLKILFQTLLFHYCWWICFSLWFSRRFSRTKPTEYAAMSREWVISYTYDPMPPGSSIIEQRTE